MDVKNIGVVGCGVMGTGIVHAAAVAGLQTHFISRSQEKVERDLDRIKKSLTKAVKKNKLTQSQADVALANVRGSDSLDDLGQCNLIIETIVEDLDGKKELLEHLDRVMSEDCILTTNTSSFSISELAKLTGRPEKFAGMHFFVPAQAMKLVEVVRGEKTSEDTVETIVGLARAMGKEPVIVKDTPGFIVNRVLAPYLNHAIQSLEDELASKEDIDKAIKLGFGITLGPLSMLDLIGLDIQLKMAETLYEKTDDPRFKPPRLLREMVEQGKLGRKSGKGFFDYGQED